MMKTIARGVNLVFGPFFNKEKVFITNSLDYLARSRQIDTNYLDYIRLATLELISSEIARKQVIGNVAELGVYKGKFARYINQYFPDRTLYLFDTFEGFDGRDVAAEKKSNFSTGEQDFSDTSVASVLKRMPFPEQCKVVKGFFPQSLNGLEDQFALVSIDTDLYQPIYSGLNYFYPRLSKGGYLLIHDFNNDMYKGARQAVEQFCRENSISYVPLPDSGGSAIIPK
jgi:O-methyltransferase